VLTANAPETKDNDFTWRDFQARNNNELVAILGNFVNRVVVLMHKYFNGAVPAAGALTELDSNVLAEIATLKDSVASNIETFHFREALREAMNIARAGNRYLQEAEPWKVAKTDMERTATILNVAAQITGALTIVMEPFLPFASERMARMLGMSEKPTWDQLGDVASIVPTGRQFGQAELLFEKIDDEAIDAQIARLARIKEENRIKAFTPAPQAADVDFDTFCRSDIRVGTVIECERVPKADKLLRFLIDDGMSRRTIVSGIAKYYAPEDLIGKQVCFIANLPIRKLRGIESQGMILSAENADGSLVVIGPTAPVVPGAQVK
jgi:methionyl-tRNA synthetase